VIDWATFWPIVVAPCAKPTMPSTPCKTDEKGFSPAADSKATAEPRMQAEAIPKPMFVANLAIPKPAATPWFANDKESLMMPRFFGEAIAAALL